MSYVLLVRTDPEYQVFSSNRIDNAKILTMF